MVCRVTAVNEPNQAELHAAQCSARPFIAGLELKSSWNCQARARLKRRHPSSGSSVTFQIGKLQWRIFKLGGLGSLFIGILGCEFSWMRAVGLKWKQAMHFPWLRFVPHRKILFKKHALHSTKQAVYPSSSLNVLPPHIANMWHMLRDSEWKYYSFGWLELGSFTERSQNMWLKLVRSITNRVNLNRYWAVREQLG